MGPCRQYDGKVTDGIAPQGLWRNCYNPEWLAMLMPHELEELDMIEGTIDLTLPRQAPESDTGTDPYHTDSDSSEDGDLNSFDGGEVPEFVEGSSTQAPF